MENDIDRVLDDLRTQQRRLQRMHSDRAEEFRLAAPAGIAETEASLGFELPPTLVAIYLSIANGGRFLGPGYGLLGLPGGYGNDDGWNILKTTDEVSYGLEWWDHTIVVCDWGCVQLSCVDCSDDSFSVFRWDGNAFEESDRDDPSEELWSLEADTFREWVVTPNLGA